MNEKLISEIIDNEWKTVPISEAVKPVNDDNYLMRDTSKGRVLTRLLTASQAREKGIKLCFTITPCKHGHRAFRRAKDSECCLCRYYSNRRRMLKNKEV